MWAGCGLKSAPIFVGREGDVGVNMAMTKFALFESEGRSGARGSGGYVGATAVVDFSGTSLIYNDSSYMELLHMSSTYFVTV